MSTTTTAARPPPPAPPRATSTASRSRSRSSARSSGGGALFLPILFAVTKRLPKLTETLVELSFIHFARWSLVPKIPYNGAPQPKQKLRYPHMYFESNFNGGWEEYIDAFSHILTSGMAAFWGSSYGFPKALPAGPFKDYIKENEIEASHYYSAYPEATITMIKAALELDDKLAPLKRSAAKMDPEAFAAAYTQDAHRRAALPVSSATTVSGQAYGFLAMTPIAPGEEDALRAYLEGLRDRGEQPVRRARRARTWRAA